MVKQVYIRQNQVKKNHAKVLKFDLCNCWLLIYYLVFFSPAFAFKTRYTLCQPVLLINYVNYVLSKGNVDIEVFSEDIRSAILSEHREIRV